MTTNLTAPITMDPTTTMSHDGTLHPWTRGKVQKGM